jgi:rare lipoprotein A
VRSNVLSSVPALACILTALASAAEPPRVQEGLASFYGGAFQGRKTASGERFDKNDLTAAHPSYPGGTLLKVTNVENSRSVNVRVIDRGPTRPARREGVIIDLSRAAARRLAFTDDGRARVRVEVLKMGRHAPR